jgi:hypothetical protein
MLDLSIPHFKGPAFLNLFRGFDEKPPYVPGFTWRPSRNDPDPIGDHPTASK